MVRALVDHGIRPDLVVGASIGAINGALLAADPGPGVVDRLTAAWDSPAARAVYGDPLPRQVHRLARTRTHLMSDQPLRHLLEHNLGADARFEDLAVPLHVVAANIERAAETWFRAGPLVPAVLASAAVPGVLPPAVVDGLHYLDGGIVNSIPLGEAVRLGARTVYVLQVGTAERELTAPRRPIDTAKVAFEIARRHRFTRESEDLPEGVRVHVLPSGGAVQGDEKVMSYRRMGPTARRIEQAYVAGTDFLDAIDEDEALMRTSLPDAAAPVIGSVTSRGANGSGPAADAAGRSGAGAPGTLLGAVEPPGEASPRGGAPGAASRTDLGGVGRTTGTTAAGTTAAEEAR